MDHRPSSAGPSPAGRVTFTLHDPISELAAALQTLADALDREQASGAVTYAAAVEAADSCPALGGMTAALADRFVASSARLPSTSWHFSATTPATGLRGPAGASQVQFGIGRVRISGELTSLAAGRKRLPREVDYPIKRDAQHRRYRIEPVAAELLLSAIDRPAAPRRPEDGARPMWMDSGGLSDVARGRP